MDAYQEYIARRRAAERANPESPVRVTPELPGSQPPSRYQQDAQRLRYDWSQPWWYMLHLADAIQYHGDRFLEENFEHSGVSAILAEALALAMSVTASAIGSFGLIWSWLALAITAPVWLPLWSTWRLCRKSK